MPPARGEQHGLAKLTDEQVMVIRQLHGQVSINEIARSFAVSSHTIRMILAGRTWRHITSQNAK